MGVPKAKRLLPPISTWVSLVSPPRYVYRFFNDRILSAHYVRRVSKTDLECLAQHDKNCALSSGLLGDDLAGDNMPYQRKVQEWLGYHDNRIHGAGIQDGPEAFAKLMSQSKDTRLVLKEPATEVLYLPVYNAHPCIVRTRV